MNRTVQQKIISSAGGKPGVPVKIQSLWGGYGSILRVPIIDGVVPSVIVKMVKFPPSASSDDRGHIRKTRSFEVESAWYELWSARCDDFCRSARCYGALCENGEVTMILEDLDCSGFPRRSRNISDSELSAVLSWLAHFHVRFLGESPKSLWPIGTYWHLSTRPDELANLADHSLRKAAPLIDSALNSSPFQTIVHGDAKLDNFCFSADGSRCAAVDFQYTGGGIGMKDLAYFLGSAYPEWECERREQEFLDRYFRFIRSAAERYGSAVHPSDLEDSWRPLYHCAWADFHRFAEGWSPYYWASNGFSAKTAQKTAERLLSE